MNARKLPGALALVPFSVASVLAQAQPITLRIADSLPAGHVIHTVVTKPFMEEVEKESKGQIKFQHFPGGQLGKAKDLLSLTQSGVVDVGYVVPAYQSDKMPLTAAMELPGAYVDYCQGMRAFYALTHDDGYLVKNEFTPNKVIPLVSFMLTPYQLVIGSKRKIETLADLEGLKVRSAGGAMDFMLKQLEVVPVRMTPPEIYESLSRGTIDGALLPYQSVQSYGLTSLLTAGTTKENFGSVVLTYSIGVSKWKQLPVSAREVLAKVAKKVSLESCQNFLKAESEAFAGVKAKGVKQIAFSPADEKSLETIFHHVGQDWAESLESRGKPGKATLKAVKSAIDQAK
jgi:TRAP-type C4-dicarboxylate transport system substrate-binding protein